LGKSIIFRATLNFSGRSQHSAKNEKKYLLNAKNGIHSIQQDEMPEIRDFCWVGLVGQSNFTG